MADIQFYQDDSEDGQDEDGEDIGLEQGKYDESLNPDEGLTSLQKLEKYMCSENVYNRQMVARSLLDTLRIVQDEKESAVKVLKIMVKLSEDSESTVRTELMEQVPHIAMFCQQCMYSLESPISTYILPVIVKYFTDTNNLVRKTSQAALLVLIEQNYVDTVSIEEKVCPVIYQLSSHDSIDDFRTEAVALMSKMAPLVGTDMTVRHFMPRFTEMCTDALFHVRKVCAANFGDMCHVVGQENTEKFLLTKFCYLCEDGVWGVRKACAECFMQVSRACSSVVRRNELTPLYVGLVCDQSRWVRMSAFQGLGEFISTFADSNITGLYIDEGELIIRQIEQQPRSEPSTPSDKGVNEVCDKTKLSSTSEEELSKSVEDMEIDDDDLQPSKDDFAKGSNTNVDSIESPSPQQVTPDSGTSVDMDVSQLETSVDSEDEQIQQSDKDTSVEEIRAEHYHTSTSREVEHVATDNNESSSENVQCQSTAHSEECSKDGSEDIPVITNVQLDTPLENCEVLATEDAPIIPAYPATSSVAKEETSDRNIAKLTLPLDSNVDDSSPTSPESFSSFLYWRDPLPALDIEDLSPSVSSSDSIASVNDIEASVPSADGAKSQEQPQSDDVAKELTEFLDEFEAEAKNKNSTEDSVFHLANENTLADPAEMVANIGSVHVLGEQLSQRTMTVVDGVVVTDYPGTRMSEFCQSPPDKVGYSPPNERELFNYNAVDLYQDVIPQELLEHYLSMTDPSRAQTVDAELAKHCAYSFPAVAFTLGRNNWNCLRDLYDTLAGDMQWKVRRTLAFSIHDLAVILGEDITTRDLVPIFNGFLRDLDEVRIGVLKHFADFLKLLKYDARQDYLKKIPELLNIDNNRNWRFREDLAHQLLLLLELYTVEDINLHLVPVVLTLCEDGVSAVRESAFRIVVGLLNKFSTEGDKQLPTSFVASLVEKFAQSTKWNMRQIYAKMCSCVLEARAMSEERFAIEMLPSLLALANDSVPNVRITLAKTLCERILTSDYLTFAHNPHQEALMATAQQLKTDKDRDVRYFISCQQQTYLSPQLDTIPV